MINLRFDGAGNRRVEDLCNLFTGGHALLLGGSPSVDISTFTYLAARGPLTMSMNNAGVGKFKPFLWCGGDHPGCYDARVLNSPTTIKFGSALYALEEHGGMRYNQYPNLRFFTPKKGIPWEDAFRFRKEVPWYNNTMYSAILILYNLGIRDIYMLGCDFKIQDVTCYSHPTKLSADELAWNRELYKEQKEELTMLIPLFDSVGLTLHSVVKEIIGRSPFPEITIEDACDVCINTPVDIHTSKLPHSSRFYTNEN